jgi:hypothetical protein
MRASAGGRLAVGRREAEILEELGNLGEFIGGLAVIITLIYLATQVRQNTASLRAASRLEIASGYRAVNRLEMDPDAARAYAKGLREYPDMPFEERSLFIHILGDHAVFFQGAFALYDTGQLEEGTYADYLTWFVCHLATPGGAAFWEEIGRPFLVKRAVEAADARLAQGGLPDITQLGIYRLDDATADPAGGTESGSTET